jgi:hypothetical protein
MVELYPTIFYPFDLRLVGYIYGWKVSKTTWCVTGVIQSDSVRQPFMSSIRSSPPDDALVLISMNMLK